MSECVCDRAEGTGVSIAQPWYTEAYGGGDADGEHQSTARMTAHPEHSQCAWNQTASQHILDRRLG
ncbi:hypothetical protein BAUCODRAFT_30709 [Baudoinia panamericana UAMH 10762]|uniref:Uncharacterized protein n=1 Tax=Baudoinia panamericana (strain UAMH 10762) TaxID=717646 RepID=M2NL89_BAUPA|nr:uncharacterized protein BAUCODRAFT_30709 [Baudoinia panamericana UAMH 10762]EMD00240.1 hypothetical protein BAUCODRAFT_30709 [Baudoinia panamericana UAMH 10762]